MKYKSTNTFLLIAAFFVFGFAPSIRAQEKTTSWTPEEQKELFGYCEKTVLMNELRIAEEKVDKIGEINYWATLQKIKVQENTNDTFATANEVEEAVIKKYKSLSLTSDQIKNLIERRKSNTNQEACPLITLNFNPVYDTAQKAQMILNFKAKYRKDLISKVGVNGRQADQLIDAAVWNQKEAIAISKIPANDFNRIRKTVEMHKMMDRKFKLIDMTEEQKQAAIEYFKQNL